MTERVTLTFFWLLSFLLSLIMVELYVGRTVLYHGDMLMVLLEDDRLEAMGPVFAIYSGHLAAILGFWFVKPFKPVKSDGAERVRFWLAVVCTLIFNGWVLYMIGRGHLGSVQAVMQDLKTAVKIATSISVVVAPVNAFYFGAKARMGG